MVQVPVETDWTNDEYGTTNDELLLIEMLVHVVPDKKQPHQTRLRGKCVMHRQTIQTDRLCRSKSEKTEEEASIARKQKQK